MVMSAISLSLSGCTRAQLDAMVMSAMTLWDNNDDGKLSIAEFASFVDRDDLSARMTIHLD
ncbi:hypothetical protein T484DRAFT_1777116 [Baffinella frigidus]|nr:hypothetical protein T484DRAFT_1777116 [Cryptophyta sp. CCMP2293]